MIADTSGGGGQVAVAQYGPGSAPGLSPPRGRGRGGARARVPSTQTVISSADRSKISGTFDTGP